MTSVAVVVTTYNRPDALAAVLEGFAGQTDTDFTLVVADDGSTDETRGVVDLYRARGAFPVEHVWHPDEGFRAAAIRNRAIERTDAEYVVFTDGDCIPMPGFVATHRTIAERGRFVSGSRVLLSERATSVVLNRPSNVQRWSWRRWLRARLRGHVNRLLPLAPLPLGWVATDRGANRWHRARTCNMGVWRDDLLAVNGFDETYEGWGMEDSDLALRLIHHGVRHRRFGCGIGVIHLWHPELTRENVARNRAILAEVEQSGRTRAQRGIVEGRLERDGVRPLETPGGSMKYDYRTVAERDFAHVDDRILREHESETALVRRFFEGTEVGVFVDVGANAPRHLSQTWHLEQRGWSGVAVEPIGELCERLRAARPRTTVVEAACADAESVGEREFFVADDWDKSTLKPNLLDFETAVDRVERVRVRTLDDVLEECGVQRVDFVSIDVEGLQLEVVRGFDLARFRPRLLFVEDHLTDLRTHLEIQKRGYRLVKRTTYNNWYVPRGEPFSLTTPAERFALWRKVYLRTPFRRLRHALKRRRSTTNPTEHRPLAAG